MLIQNFNRSNFAEFKPNIATYNSYPIKIELQLKNMIADTHGLRTQYGATTYQYVHDKCL